MPLNATITRIGRVTEEERSAMFDLHTRYYENVRRETFAKDMAQKDWVIVLRDRSNRIEGFSTLQVIMSTVGNKPCAFLYSGDTVVERDHWQDSTLAGGFCHFMKRMIQELPETKRYWLLISKGFRTYRYLPVFFNAFYPVHTAPTPAEFKHLLDHICFLKFNGRYHSGKGIILSSGDTDYLKPDLLTADIFRRNDPHINFFHQKNPGYIRGDELACIAEIAYGNFNRRIMRVLDNTRVEWYE